MEKIRFLSYDGGILPKFINLYASLTIMDHPKKVPQIQFDTLEEFIEGSNNFFSLFLDNHRSRKDEPFYQRFKEKYPELAAELDEAVTIDRYNYGHIQWEKRFPWDKLWEAYKVMSELVYLGDPYVQGEDHCTFLMG